MEYNGKKGVHTTTFLNEVHAVMSAKYLTNKDRDIAEAKKLQDFFQMLKRAASDINTLPSNLDKELFQQLLDRTTQIFEKKIGSAKTKDLFRRMGKNSYERGDIFERELSAVIQAVAEKASNKVSLGGKEYEIRTGQQTGSTTLTDDLIQAFQEKLKEGFTKEKALKELQSASGEFQKRVQIKTDIQGISVEIDASMKGTPIEEIQQLLSQATFTAKSYASEGFNTQTQKMEMINDLYPTIHLGNSNPVRAVYGALTSLGYNSSTATSAYAASSHLIKKNNQKVINHIYHLRYLYELTGAGTKMLTGEYKEARFLIYNDPATDNIYVKSSAEILAEVFNDGSNWNGDPFGGIVIYKSKFE